MSGTYWELDPSTGDYIMENGRPVETDSLEVPAYYRIKTSRQKWMYAPDTNYGSDLNTLKKNTGTAALTMVDQALQPLIDNGQADTVDAEFNTNVTLQRSNSAINVNITAAGGEVQTLELPELIT